ncbi:hypothetical protein LIER_27859 [Lithospermum erythrorhizon]|uniref:Uncharacterized protein n=1 Tax=Lithospermum erythrorhizon TaxID=34254 RepID=A0AAV3RF86_LITER
MADGVGLEETSHLILSFHPSVVWKLSIWRSNEAQRGCRCVPRLTIAWIQPCPILMHQSHLYIRKTLQPYLFERPCKKSAIIVQEAWHSSLEIYPSSRVIKELLQIINEGFPPITWGACGCVPNIMFDILLHCLSICGLGRMILQQGLQRSDENYPTLLDAHRRQSTNLWRHFFHVSCLIFYYIV